MYVSPSQPGENEVGDRSGHTNRTKIKFWNLNTSFVAHRILGMIGVNTFLRDCRDQAGCRCSTQLWVRPECTRSYLWHQLRWPWRRRWRRREWWRRSAFSVRLRGSLYVLLLFKTMNVVSDQHLSNDWIKLHWTLSNIECWVQRFNR